MMIYIYNMILHVSYSIHITIYIYHIVYRDSHMSIMSLDAKPQSKDL